MFKNHPPHRSLLTNCSIFFIRSKFTIVIRPECTIFFSTNHLFVINIQRCSPLNISFKVFLFKSAVMMWQPKNNLFLLSPENMRGDDCEWSALHTKKVSSIYIHNISSCLDALWMIVSDTFTRYLRDLFFLQSASYYSR